MKKRVLVTLIVLAAVQASDAHGMWMIKKAKDWWTGKPKESSAQHQKASTQPEEFEEVMSLRGTTMYKVPKKHLKDGVKKQVPAPEAQPVAPQIQEVPEAQVLDIPVALAPQIPALPALVEVQPSSIQQTPDETVPELEESAKTVVAYVGLKELIARYQAAQQQPQTHNEEPEQEALRKKISPQPAVVSCVLDQAEYHRSKKRALATALVKVQPAPQQEKVVAISPEEALELAEIERLSRITNPRKWAFVNPREPKKEMRPGLKQEFPAVLSVYGNPTTPKTAPLSI